VFRLCFSCEHRAVTALERCRDTTYTRFCPHNSVVLVAELNDKHQLTQWHLIGAPDKVELATILGED